MHLLVLYKALWHSSTLKKSVYDHLHVFDYIENANVYYWNVADGIPSWLSNYGYDVIVLHSTLLSARYGDQGVYQFWKEKLLWLKNNPAVKIAFPQDERYYCDELVNWCREIDVSVIFSVFACKPEILRMVYGAYVEESRFYPCYTGYVDDITIQKFKPINWLERTYDVVYRAKRLPVWVGRYGQIKTRLHEKLCKYVENNRLKTNTSIEKKDIITGDRWIRFIADSRYILGCEAGGSGIDRLGEITRLVKYYASQSKTISEQFELVDRERGENWDGHKFTTIGPRNFEAALSKTCQILVRGDYGGVMEAGIHYIPLEPDLSDFEQVLTGMTDEKGMQVAEQAYQDIAMSPGYRYSHFAKEILKVLGEYGISDKAAAVKPFALVCCRIKTFYLARGLLQIPSLLVLFIKSSIYRARGERTTLNSVVGG